MSAPWNPPVSGTIQRALALTGCAGVAEMAAELIEARTQRDAAEVQRYAALKEIDRLTALIPKPPTRPLICECPGYENVQGPYPSGFCRECGRWYPPKRAEVV